MSVVWLLTVAFFQSQGHEARAVKLVDEAAGLSRLLGVPITVDPVLRNESLLVRDSGSDAGSTLAAVAKAVHGSAMRTADGWTIQRSPIDRADIERTRAANRAAWIREGIREVARYRESLGGDRVPPSTLWKQIDEENRQIKEVEHGRRQAQVKFFASELLPSQWLLESLVTQIGLDTLAKLPTGQTEIFEDRPAPGCQPLAVHSELIAEFGAKMQRFHAMIIPESASRSIEERYRNGAFAGVGQDSEPPQLLRLRVDPELATLGFILEGYDRQGRLTLSANMMTPAEGKEVSPHLVAAEAKRSANPEWVDLDARSDPEVDDQELASSKPVAERLIHPEREDPLNRSVAPVIEKLAESESSLCVIQLSDPLWQAARVSVQHGRLSLASLRSVMSISLQYERTTVDGFVIWRSADPDYVSPTHANRKSLGQFARQVLREGPPTMREYCQFRHDVGGIDSPLPEVWLAWEKSFTGDTGRPTLTTEMARFIGSISDVDWERLSEGQSLTAAQLGITDALQSLLLKTDSSPPQGMNSDTGPFRHPIELLRGGSVGDCQVRLRDENEPVFRWRSLRGGDETFWEPYSAMSRYFRVPVRLIGPDAPKIVMTRSEYESRLDRQNRFRTALRPHAYFEISLLGKGTLQAEYVGNPVRESSGLVYTDLPEEVRANGWRAATAASLASAQRKLGHLGG